MMRIDILTILPGLLDSAFAGGMIRKAIDKSLLQLNVVNIRDFAEGAHRVTDDYPFGGGHGMILKPEPIVRAVESLPDPKHVVLLSPQGTLFDQKKAAELAEKDHLVFICGRYEGVDERVIELVVDEELSIGDYVLTGGEFPAVIVMDAVVRLRPGVLNKDGAAGNDSIATGLLEGPQYTRPREFRGLRVPEVLLSGNHAEIDRWRRRQSLLRTLQRRPDLLEQYPLTEEDVIILKELKAAIEQSQVEREKEGTAHESDRSHRKGTDEN